MRQGLSGVVGTLLFLTIHGILLWLVVPVGFLLWTLTLQGLGKRRTSLPVFLGWLDHNVLVALIRGPLRYFFVERPMDWIPPRDRAATTHRIRGMAFF